uniref:Uncharacterized protein n=1 Tax=Romanomermis culicivorax TaxID=13658 RepID=A0A915KK63_ROMCU
MLFLRLSLRGKAKRLKGATQATWVRDRHPSRKFSHKFPFSLRSSSAVDILKCCLDSETYSEEKSFLGGLGELQSPTVGGFFSLLDWAFCKLPIHSIYSLESPTVADCPRQES